MRPFSTIVPILPRLAAAALSCNSEVCPVLDLRLHLRVTLSFLMHGWMLACATLSLGRLRSVPMLNACLEWNQTMLPGVDGI